jgi:hypothetical protein
MPQIVNLTLTPSTEPELCRVAADFRLPDGRPINRLHVRILTWPDDQGALVAQSLSVLGAVDYYTDRYGHVEFDLVQGGTFVIWLGLQTEVRHKFVCPDVAEANLFDYLYPYLASIEMSESSYAMEVGETIGLLATGTYSDGSTCNVTSAVTFQSGNSSIASISNASVTGESVGSTTINIDSVLDSALPEHEDMLERSYVHIPSPFYVIGTNRTVTVS